MITLFCMSEKGLRVLEKITACFPDIIECVVSSRDQNVEKDYYDEIEIFCGMNGLSFIDRKNLKTVKSRYAIAVSWRWLIDSPSTILIIFHDSMLPKYRGFSPLVSALINGDTKIGVTALLATDDYDKGDIIAQSSTIVNYPLKIQNAIELLSKNYQELAIEIIKKISEEKNLHGIKQNEHEASYSLWRDDDDYFIDWGQPADQIKRFIDAVGYPYSGAMTMIRDKKIKVLDAEVVADVCIENRVPGKVIFMKDNKPVIVCGTGLLIINNILDNETSDSLLPFSNFRIRFK